MDGVPEYIYVQAGVLKKVQETVIAALYLIYTPTPLRQTLTVIFDLTTLTTLMYTLLEFPNFWRESTFVCLDSTNQHALI